jgi:hypothetical protein
VGQFKDQSKIRALAAAMIDQAKRSVRRPSRLLFVPFLLPSYFPRLLTLLLSILLVKWPHGERGKAFRLAIGNLVLLRHDRAEEAWYWMQRVLRTARRSTEEYFLGAVCLYQGLGRLGEATSLFARANDLDFVKAESLGVANSPYRVLDEIWARHIGDAATLDYVIKQGILEGRRREDIKPLSGAAAGGEFAPGRTAGRFAVRRRCRASAALPLSISAVAGRGHGFFLGAGEQGSAALAQRRPRSAVGAAAGHAARGWALLQAAGVPRGAWFVALHVRDIAWKGLTAGMQPT